MGKSSTSWIFRSIPVLPVLLVALFWNALPKLETHAQTVNAPTANSAPKKRALLVGISDYCPKPGSVDCSPTNSTGKYWWSLNSKADVEVLAEILKTNYHFDEVTILQTKAETTHKAIIDAFKSKLIGPTQENDIVYFHYSGHGASIPDDGDPGDIEPDGKDESLVPSDYKSRQDFSNNIRDDEIGRLLDELSARKPGNVTVSMDSCHSGTATRGGDEVALQRGESWQGEMPENSARGNDGADDKGSGLTRGNEVPKNYLFLAAANPRQTAWEYASVQKDKTGKNQSVKMGLFTYALAKALRQATDKTSYRDLFYQISATIAGAQRIQNPQIEGSIDTAVLNGSALPVDPFILVVPGSDGKPLLQAGDIQGMTRGSKFAICPAGTRNKDECRVTKLAEATIEDVYQRESLLTVQGNKKLDLIPGKPLRAFETERALDFSALKVLATDDLDQLPGGKDALASIRKFALGEPASRGSGNYDVMVRPVDKEDKMTDFSGAILQRSDGAIFGKVPAGPDLGKRIRGYLENEIRWKTVANMNNVNPNLGVEMRLYRTAGMRKNGIFEESKEGELMVEAAKKDGGSGGGLQLLEDEFVRLEIRNPNAFPVYVTVLDLMPDGRIGAAFPNPGKCLSTTFQESSDCNNKIEPGATLKQYFRMVPPEGRESFKALVTRDYTDFSPLVTPDGPRAAGRGSQHPIGTILRALYDPDDTIARRGIENMTAEPQTWTAQTVTFEVRKKP